MDQIQLLQYKNLRRCVKENLINTILGKDYYNMGADVYSCDERTTKDIKDKFDCLQRDLKMYKYFLKLIAIITVCLFTTILIITRL